MSSPPTIAALPGSVIAWWDGQNLCFGVIDAEEKQRVHVVDGRGKELRVKPSKVAIVAERPGAIPGREPERRAALVDRIRAAESRIRAEAAEIDVPLLWELATEEGASMGSPTAEVLADLAVGRTDGSATAATMVALLDDNVRFSRKSSCWSPRSPEAVAGLLRQREVVHRRDEETRRFLECVAGLARGEAYVPTGDETEELFLRSLTELAVRREETGEPMRRRAHQALTSWGESYVRDFEGAFRLLRLLGRFDSDDANLQIQRFGLPGEFSAEIVRRATALAEAAPQGARRDLTSLLTVTVDGASTRELDDALSIVTREDGGFRLGIHIADPSAFVPVGDLVDLEALSRGTTHYFPDGKIPMFPTSICESCASLVAGERRPAISFLVELSGDGSVRSSEIVRSWIRCDARWTYEELDERLTRPGTDPLDELARGLAAAGKARLALRCDAGAVHLAGQEAELAVVDGAVVLNVRERDAPSQVAVSEAMVLVGELAGERLAEAGATAIFRGQSEPFASTEEASDGSDPSDLEIDAGAATLLHLHQTRRRLRRAESALRPKPHHSLALPVYVQATSPLRRFQDLVNQRQLISVLENDEPRYSREELQQILATTDAAERRARRAEREAIEYWMLRWLEPQEETTLQAIVLATDPKPWVLLLPCLWERPLPGLAGRRPGESVQIRVGRVSPRAGMLQLHAL